MDFKVKCLQCNTEVEDTGKFHTCGCPNGLSFHNGKITAIDLDLVAEVPIYKQEAKVHKPSSYLTPEDMAFQEDRKRRKVKRLSYEVR